MALNNLDSMYADYKLEFEDVRTVFEPGVGFANYSIERSDKTSLDLYIQEVYVVPHNRGHKWAAQLTDNCITECELITGKTVKTIYTTVGVGGNTTHLSLRAITEYGFKLLKSNEKLIYFYKEINKCQNL